MSKEDDAYAEAQRLIEEAREMNADKLDLRIRNLPTIPPEIVALINLFSLDLSRTKVSDLSPLARLSMLSKLYLSGTKVSDLTPLAMLSTVRELAVRKCPVRSLSPIAALTNLYQLEMDHSAIADLRPVTGFTELASNGFPFGFTFSNSLATRLDPNLAILAEIRDNAERARETFAYLDSLGPDYDAFLKRRMIEEGIDPADYFPDSPETPGDARDDFPSLQQIEQAISGPILSDSLIDVAEAQGQLHAVPLLKGTSKPRDAEYETLVQVLAFAARSLAGNEAQNRLSDQLVKAFAAYAPEVEKDEPNARILHFLAESIRGAMASEHDRAALDGFDTGGITDFLRNHDELLNTYFAESLRPAAQVSQADPEELAIKAPAQLRAIRDALALDDIGLLAPNVSDAQEMLERREEGIRRGYLTGDTETRAQAAQDLGKVAVLQTGFLGVLTRRLKLFSEWGKRELQIGRDDPMGAAGRWGGASAGLEQAVRYADKLFAALYPTFAQLWKMVTDLALPF